LAVQQTVVLDETHQTITRRSPSPPLPDTTIPSFIPSGGLAENNAQNEEVLKDRFRKFWMASIADGFKDDLEEIRKVCTNTMMHTDILLPVSHWRIGT
jgi:hypothetical protein